MPPSTVDPLDSPTATDIDKVYLAHDAQYIYIRFTLHAPGDPFTSHNNFFIDADGNGGTGFNAHGIGSEMLIQSGAGYQEKNGGFNEGGINGLDWSAAPSGVATDFELRISRAATYAGDGLPVFTSPNIAVLLEAEDAGFVPREFAPDSGGIAYELTAPPPSAPPGAIRLAAVNDTWWVNQNDIFTNAAWSDPSYNPFGQDAWEQGEGLFGFSPTPGVYPLPWMRSRVRPHLWLRPR